MREKKGIQNKIIINETYWSEFITSDCDTIQNHSSALIKRSNDILRKLYDIIKADLPESAFVKFSECELIAKHDHQWGVSPFHYIDNYYKKIISFLYEKERIDFLHNALSSDFVSVKLNGGCVDVSYKSNLPDSIMSACYFSMNNNRWDVKHYSNIHSFQTNIPDEFIKGVDTIQIIYFLRDSHGNRFSMKLNAEE